MSRLGSMSANALKALFDIESNDTLITLVTFKQNIDIGISSNIYLTDTAVQRISETADDVVYGVVSNSINYTYLPLEITLPNDDATSSPKCQLVIHDVTRYLIPSIRSLTGPPEITLQLVLSSSPNTIEISYSGFKLTNVVYNANTISGDLTIPSLEIEPFPAHSFTPAYFPGLF
jgi:hypothetical protein